MQCIHNSCFEYRPIVNIQIIIPYRKRYPCLKKTTPLFPCPSNHNPIPCLVKQSSCRPGLASLLVQKIDRYNCHGKKKITHRLTEAPKRALLGKTELLHRIGSNLGLRDCRIMTEREDHHPLSSCRCVCGGDVYSEVHIVEARAQR